MKKVILLSATIFCLQLFAQEQKPETKMSPPPSIKKQINFKSSPYSIGIGYGTRGFNLKADMALISFNNNKSTTRVYVDGTYQTIKFSQSNFSFNYILYPSNVFLLTIGGGLSQEFVLDRLTLAPLLGIKYNYVRFTDKALVDAIGTNGMNRLIYDSWGNEIQVGPTVDNGYGNSISFEIGTRAGIKITEWLEINGTVAFNPISFSTAATLFGEYRGEAPYVNDYYVNPTPIKAEGNIRFTFGH
jgi:hypothetical protein